MSPPESDSPDDSLDHPLSNEATGEAPAIVGPASALDVSLLIPTFNAGPEFPAILDAFVGQRLAKPLEIVVVDSGSTDGTRELLRQRAKQGQLELIEIPNHEFNHGATRNLGIAATHGDVVALSVQDARPTDDQWLARLVATYDDPQVAGAYSAQLPRHDANPFIKDRLRSWVASQTEPRRQSVASVEEFEALEPLEKLSRVAFDNVASSVRRSVVEAIPFRERQFGEDLDWGHRAILAGHTVVFEPRSQVIHSHDKSIWYEAKRVYLDHQNLHRLFGVHTVPAWENVRAGTRWAIGHLQGVVDADPDLGPWQRRWWRAKAVPFGFSQNFAQFLGARSVARLDAGDRFYRLLDRWLRRGV